MLTKSTEHFIGRWLYLGAPAVTLLVTSSINMDPVNVSKLLLTSGIGFALLALVLSFGRKLAFKESRMYSIALGLFVLWEVVATFASKSPFTQNLYGLNGRNTGLLAYFTLACVALGASVLRSRIYFTKIVMGLLIAGGLNIIYCLIALNGHDFIGWNNVYNTILGTFGNPDFISAFLGIFIVSLIAYISGPGQSWAIRIIGIVMALIALYEIHKSHAIQGLAVTGLGLVIVGFYLVRSWFKNNLLIWLYVFIVGVIASFAIAGALQVGPLTQYIYKTSITLRGSYWRAGIKMATDHPLFGVGPDSYGDWYRRARDARAMILPGPTTVTNAAHNVVVDIFASGGFPLLIAYLSIAVVTLIAIIRVTRRSRKYDAVFVALAVGWVAYFAQSVISINQIGLAMWGWILSGALIAYEIATRNGELANEASPKEKNNKNVKRQNDSSASAFLLGFSGFAVGIIIALPPFIGDASYRSAVTGGKLEQVVAAANKFPEDSMRMTQAVALFEDNKAFQQAHMLALKAVSYNPDFFDGWRILGYISTSTAVEKKLALENMQRLDPLNKEWKKVTP